MNVHELTQALAAATAEGARVFPEARGEAVWDRIKKNAYHEGIVRETRACAARYLSEPISELAFGDFELFFTTGDRDTFERQYFDRRGRLSRLCTAYLLDGGDETLAALEDAIWALCGEYTWCLPACLGNIDIMDRRAMVEALDKGFTGASPREHARVIDLFAAETGFAIAEALSLVGEKMHPLVVDRAKKEILRRIIEPYMEINTPFHWESGTGNWTAVCAGSVGGAAIYTVSDDAALASILRKVTDSMERYLSGFTSEGVCTEGIGYWDYGFTFFMCFAELLCQRTGGRVDIMMGERQKTIAMFIQRCRVHDNLFPMFSDAWPNVTFNMGLFEHLHRKFPEVEVPPDGHRRGAEDDHTYRFCSFIRDFVWAEGVKTPREAGGDERFDEAQWMLSRSSKAPGTAFLAKGGSNGEPHNQNDVGSFHLYIGGELIFPDLGAGEYTRQYFGPERYELFNPGSQGHSVPIVSGQYQKTGKCYACKDYTSFAEGGLAGVSMDIAGAYGVDGLRSLKRTMRFDKDHCVFSLEDAYDMECAAPVIERVILASTTRPEVSGGEVRVFGKSVSAVLRFDLGDVDCVLSDAPADAVFGIAGYGIYTLDLSPRVPSATWVFRMTVEPWTHGG